MLNCTMLSATSTLLATASSSETTRYHTFSIYKESTINNVSYYTQIGIKIKLISATISFSSPLKSTLPIIVVQSVGLLTVNLILARTLRSTAQDPAIYVCQFSRSSGGGTGSIYGYAIICNHRP